ncbi:hypothetical protein [Fangia hongkongensis]|uniref:hypothetical protein n=1 Tax=Fangia hongkongensis TaxID=270495 RepID=UPI00036A4664|nr:hypothetical protein [Fangia hongkongensis]MBK2124556.1 hypothetical protein [Fangia hongkongensis]
MSESKVERDTKHFWQYFKRNMINMKVADIDRETTGQIVLRIASNCGMRSLFHNIGSSYFLPEEIIEKDIELFSLDEKKLIYACHSYNNALQQLANGVDVSSVVLFGDKTMIQIYNQAKNSTLCYEFDESQFTEMMKKYTSRKEIRKLLHDLFARKK